MKPANQFIFFKEVNNGINATFDLTDRKIKSFTFVKGSKSVKLSANYIDSAFNLVYVCFEKDSYVCSDQGDIPQKEIYSVITAIVNNYLG